MIIKRVTSIIIVFISLAAVTLTAACIFAKESSNVQTTIVEKEVDLSENKEQLTREEFLTLLSESTGVPIEQAILPSDWQDEDYPMPITRAEAAYVLDCLIQYQLDSGKEYAFSVLPADDEDIDDWPEWAVGAIYRAQHFDLLPIEKDGTGMFRPSEPVSSQDIEWTLHVIQNASSTKR